MKNPSIFQALGNKRIEQLDGLRGVCVLAVLINHLHLTNFTEGAYRFTALNDIKFYPFLFLRSINSFGHIALLIFFVLSGFVIGYTTPQNFTWREAYNYIIRRLIRIYPIYLFTIFLTFTFADTPYTYSDVINHLFFMQGWLVPVIKNNLPLWSLHYEVIFYLLFLLIWKFNIKINNVIFVCILSGTLSAFFKLHLFEIFGYFTFWVSGLSLAKNMNKLKLVSQYFVSYRFWSPCIIMAAFTSQNILNIAINKYGAHSYIITDMFLVVLVTSSVASLITGDKGDRIIGYNLSLFVIILIEIITIIYALHQHTFYSLDGLIFGYQASVFWMVIWRFSLLIKKIPMQLFNKLSSLGSCSYALYIIHYPILMLVYRMLDFNNHKTLLNLWIYNLVVCVVAVLISWFLECYVHVKIAKILKIQFNLI